MVLKQLPIGQSNTGFIKSLDKCKGDGWVDSYRPITVYSLLYRAWSTHRAKCALKSLGEIMPSSVRGGIPARQAKSVWFEVAQLVELAQTTNTNMYGLAIDICRAFNSIPRLPIWAALTKMNFPTSILRAWGAFISSQCRHFTVRRSVGAPIQSTVGFPEGCAMSVFAMSILDWTLDLWISASMVSPCQLYAYVDDWQWIFSAVEQYPRLWSSLESFTSAWQLEIDLKKSFAWALDGEGRKIMAEQNIQVVYAAKDLGAHQNFSRRAGNVELQKRLANMPRVWKKLQLSQAPYRFKVVALYQMGWPKALHGISITNLGASHFVKLRTGAMKGLRADKIGANPNLHLCVHNPLADPELYAIYQSLRECRELGQIDQFRGMLQLVAVQAPEVPRNGPTFLLTQRLSQLGWQLHLDGTFSDVFGRIDIFSTSLEQLYQRLKWSWPQTLQCAVAHRASFQGINQTDLDELAVALSRFGACDQAYLRSSLDGTLYTDVHKDKQERSKSSRCTFCHAIDSFQHRVWHCPAFAQARSGFPWLDSLDRFPPCLLNHGWPVTPPSWIRFVVLSNQLPEVSIDAAVLPAAVTLDVFTDGSCMFPKDHKLRVASWAITAACPHTMVDSVVVQCGHLSGQQQTAFRAELTAVLVSIRLAVQRHQPMRIWSDCQAVLNRAKRILMGGAVKNNSRHADLWQQLVDLREQGANALITLHKVVSHCALELADTDLERWAFWHNSLVDTAAEQWNKMRPQSFWESWLQMSSDVIQGRLEHFEILKVHLAVGRLGDRLEPPKPESGILRAPRKKGRRFLRKDRSGEPVVPIPAKWSVSRHLGKRCGESSMHLLRQWWERVGVPACSSQQQLQWISGLHLFLDFLFQQSVRGWSFIEAFGMMTKPLFLVTYVWRWDNERKASCMLWGSFLVKTVSLLRRNWKGRARQPCHTGVCHIVWDGQLLAWTELMVGCFKNMGGN